MSEDSEIRGTLISAAAYLSVPPGWKGPLCHCLAAFPGVTDHCCGCARGRHAVRRLLGYLGAEFGRQSRTPCQLPRQRCQHRPARLSGRNVIQRYRQRLRSRPRPNHWRLSLQLDGGILSDQRLPAQVFAFSQTTFTLRRGVGVRPGQTCRRPYRHSRRTYLRARLRGWQPELFDGSRNSRRLF